MKLNLSYKNEFKNSLNKHKNNINNKFLIKITNILMFLDNCSKNTILLSG